MSTEADLVFAALANKSGLTPASAYSITDHARYVLLNGSSGGGGITPPVGDIGGTAGAPTVVSTHLAAPLPVNQGGTGSTTQNTNPGDTTTKSYVDAAIAALQLKPEAQWGTTAALPTNTYLAGVITAVGNGALSVDSNAPAVGDRVLVKNEVTQANDGLYSVTATGSAGAVFVLTRVTDMNTNASIPGALVIVQKGTVNAGSMWGVFNPGPFTIGTTAIVWTGLDVGPDLVAGTGIVITGSTIAANTLDTIPAPAAAVAFNAKKGTGIANGTAATDIAAFGQISLVPVNTQVASYTLVLADAGECVELNVAGSNTLTVPLNATVAYPIGTVIEVCQYGAGQTTITATGGVTIHTAQSLTTRAQYSTVCLRKRATDEWILSGDLT